MLCSKLGADSFENHVKLYPFSYSDLMLQLQKIIISPQGSKYLLIDSIVHQKLWHQRGQEGNPYSKTKATSWPVKGPPQPNGQGCQGQRQLDIVGKIHLLCCLLRISLEIPWWTRIKQFLSFCFYFGSTEKSIFKTSTVLPVSSLTQQTGVRN